MYSNTTFTSPFSSEVSRQTIQGDLKLAFVCFLCLKDSQLFRRECERHNFKVLWNERSMWTHPLWQWWGAASSQNLGQAPPLEYAGISVPGCRTPPQTSSTGLQSALGEHMRHPHDDNVQTGKLCWSSLKYKFDTMRVNSVFIRLWCQVM